MLFKKDDEVHIVRSCPVSKASAGVMEFPPHLIASISGAVQDSIEWMVLLLGERSADGFHVKVTDFRVPKQRRSGADVKMAEPMEGDGSTVDDAVVGVLHSHHRMGAFFSGTDNTELNPFFKSSIVVAQAKTALGFAYKAEMKVILPCGSVGKVDAFLKVTGSERWNAVEKHEVDGRAGFGDCDQLVVEVTETETETVTKKVAPEACGLSSESKAERAFVFSQAGGKELLAEIEQQTVSRAPDEKIFGNGSSSHYHGGSQQGSLGKLSRRERKRFRRADKLSARKDGTIHLAGSGAVDVCEHSVPLFVDCAGCESEGDNTFNRDSYGVRYPLNGTTGFPPYHQSAGGVLINSKDSCEFDLGKNEHDSAKLYLYSARNGRWRMWLCQECYDWWMDGARDTFESEVDETHSEDCRHSVPMTEHCEECADTVPPKQLTGGSTKWDNVAKEVLTAEEYEKAKKEHAERMLEAVSEKEARATITNAGVVEKETAARALKVSERLGIVSGNVH